MNYKNNRITKLFGIKYPLIEGGMAWVGTAKLAAAVSNAGGLGTIGSGSMTPEILEKEIKRIKTLTDKPFAVNVIMLNPYVEEIIDLLIKEKVPVAILAAGNPGKYIDKLKKVGIKVAAVVSSENLALRLEKKGIDAIIGEGMECGGHIGDVTTMVLIPKLTETLSVPVVAAGGIADYRGALASFMLGAEGIQMGTRFVATVESEAHENYKNKIVKSGIRDTLIAGARLGHPARSLKNKFMKNVIKAEVSSAEEAEEMMLGSLKRAFIEGDNDNAAFMAGQSTGLVSDIKTVEEVITDIFEKIDEKLKTFLEVNLQ
ncbi:MAG: enoyl-[acyl-carrier protein] reductase [Geotoga sp.]|jgi:enoyl-[acyl-carrier protein] reductase II|nr:enoyl-[acyl-carrier protein] reductase [Geotoga sp.]